MEQQTPIRDRVLSFVRHIISFVGAFYLGRQFLGNTVDESTLESVGGVLLTIIGVGWSIVEKNVTIEKVQGAIRQIVTVIGGLLVSSGRLSQGTVETILSLSAVLIPFIQSLLSRNKAAKLASREIQPAMLKK